MIIQQYASSYADEVFDHCMIRGAYIRCGLDFLNRHMVKFMLLKWKEGNNFQLSRRWKIN